ncbi:hypothetical protein ABIE65_001815 [Constrictibacter sp. MBR-5]|jgi:hypothetical protein|uniref:hypothetical protein n=1 Tax=Constrictibacter sp. MBR-5 TaxID=3156467 RepID=UPI003393C40F
MVLVAAGGLTDRESDAALRGYRALFWAGIAVMTSLVIWYDRALFRTGSPVLNQMPPTPERRIFRPSGLGLVSCFIGVIAYATASVAATAWLCLTHGMGGDGRRAFTMIAATLLSALLSALAVVVLWRVGSDPDRASRQALILDRNGLTIDGWKPQRFDWSDVTDIRHFTLSRKGFRQHQLEVRLRDGAPGLRRRWWRRQNIVRHPLANLPEYPDQIVGEARAFLDRARREQAAAPPHPSPSQ